MEIEPIRDKNKLIEFINKNDKFWKMVDYIDWMNLTEYGKNDNHHDYMNKAKDKFIKYVNQEVTNSNRNNKLKSINKEKFSHTVYEHQLYNKYSSIYKILLKSLYTYFKDLWLGNIPEYKIGLEISDDSFWDLRSSLIGYGKDFLLRTLDDNELVYGISMNRNFSENFGYIFPLTN